VLLCVEGLSRECYTTFSWNTLLIRTQAKAPVFDLNPYFLRTKQASFAMQGNGNTSNPKKTETLIYQQTKQNDIKAL
jgi:hypothetical protein